MGYYSTYEGEYKPIHQLTKKEWDTIREWFAKRFNDYCIVLDKDDPDFRVVSVDKNDSSKFYKGDIFFDLDGSVKPVSSYMKGYDFNEHLVEFVNFIKTIGIEYTGEVEREGEERGDFERISVEGFNVYSRQHIEHCTLCTDTEADKMRKMEMNFSKIFNKEVK